MTARYRLSLRSLCVALVTVTLALAPAAAMYSTLLFDDFTGDSLDPGRWQILEQHGSIAVTGGLLVLEGGDHKQVISTNVFAPSSVEGVVARSQLQLAGDYQKFGFNVNYVGSGPTRGYYFDTYERGDPRPEFAGYEHHVRALAVEVEAGGAATIVLDVTVPVSWYVFHEFAVEWTSSGVVFRIDGQEVAQVADAFTSALPVGVWNDRPFRMEFDWVDVNSFAVAATVPIDIKPDSFPNTVNPKSQGVIPVAVLATSSFDPLTLDVATIRFGVTGQEAAAVHAAPADVNGDGLTDLILHFWTQDTGIGCGTTTATLTGLTSGGSAITGADSVSAAGCQ